MQTTLDSFFKIEIQDTIPSYIDSNIRNWDKHVSLKSRKWPNYEITCSFFKNSFISENLSLVRCNSSDNNLYSNSTLCHLCPLERTKRVWLPVKTETRKRPIFISYRQERKFSNWRKE